MATVSVPVPNLGDSITEGTVVSWTKAEGDAVAQDEIILVLETDKVSVDIRTPSAGVLTKRLSAEGDTVKVAQIVFEIDVSDSDSISSSGST